MQVHARTCWHSYGDERFFAVTDISVTGIQNLFTYSRRIDYIFFSFVINESIPSFLKIVSKGL